MFGVHIPYLTCIDATEFASKDNVILVLRAKGGGGGDFVLG